MPGADSLSEDVATISEADNTTATRNFNGTPLPVVDNTATGCRLRPFRRLIKRKGYDDGITVGMDI